jgi:hypothetical protein
MTDLTGEALWLAELRKKELEERRDRRELTKAAPKKTPRPARARRGSELYELACSATRRRPNSPLGEALQSALTEKSGVRR